MSKLSKPLFSAPVRLFELSTLIAEDERYDPGRILPPTSFHAEDWLDSPDPPSRLYLSSSRFELPTATLPQLAGVDAQRFRALARNQSWLAPLLTELDFATRLGTRLSAATRWAESILPVWYDYEAIVQEFGGGFRQRARHPVVHVSGVRMNFVRPAGPTSLDHDSLPPRLPIDLCHELLRVSPSELDSRFSPELVSFVLISSLFLISLESSLISNLTF